MTATRTRLEDQITEALGTVREAEAAYQHCPSTSNQNYVEMAWLRLDRLLDRLPRQQED